MSGSKFTTESRSELELSLRCCYWRLTWILWEERDGRCFDNLTVTVVNDVPRGIQLHRRRSLERPVTSRREVF